MSSFHHSKPIPFIKFPFLPTMSEQLGFPPHFQLLFKLVLQTYKKETGVILAKHPLTMQLHSCHSVKSITTILEGQAQHLTNFPGGDRIIRSIQNTISILTRHSSATFGLVYQNSMACFTYLTHFCQTLPPSKAILAGLTVLLAVCPIP